MQKVLILLKQDNSHNKFRHKHRNKKYHDDIMTMTIVMIKVSHFTCWCSWLICSLTLILLMWRIWWDTNNASRWQMGFNLAFKGLILCSHFILNSPSPTHLPLPLLFLPVSGCEGCLNPIAVSSHHGEVRLFICIVRNVIFLWLR